MYYSSNFKTELHTSRFDRWRVDYDLLFKVIEAKDNHSVNNLISKQNGETSKDISIHSSGTAADIRHHWLIVFGRSLSHQVSKMQQRYVRILSK